MRNTLKVANVGVLLFAVFISMYNVTFAQQALDTNLIGYWTFDDQTARDVSGNNHHGIIHGSPTSVMTKNGTLGFHFNGIDDFIEIPFHEDLNVEDFTLTFWFSRDSDSKPGVTSLINKSWSKRNEGTSADVITMIPSDRDFTAYLNWNGLPDYPTDEYFEDENFNMINDSLFFVAFVKDGRNVRLTINDKTVLTRTLPNNTDLYRNAPEGIWTFAAQYDNGSLKTFFQGILDNVRLYKVGLPEEIIEEIYLGNNVPLAINASGEYLCLQDSILLKASEKFKHYLWSTGDTTDYIYVIQEGEYKLTAWNHPKFPNYATYTVRRQPLPTLIFAIPEKVIYLQTEKIPEERCVQIPITNNGSSLITLQPENLWFRNNVYFSLPLSQFPIFIDGGGTRNVSVCFYRDGFSSHEDFLRVETYCSLDSIQFVAPQIPLQLSGNSRCDVKVIANGVEQKFRLQVAPIPINDEINVTISAYEEKEHFFTSSIELKFVLYDIFGRKIHSISKEIHAMQGFIIDSHNLPSGTYILVVENTQTPTQIVIYKL